MIDKLKKYKQKRNFNKTKEPVGKKRESLKELKFVVQHHLARKDHYDFRLEWNGTLKSWAVPKGPSYNPDDKRLAVEVEDHPFSYRNFEGTIPKGEYGGGTVMIWDEGIWEPINNPNEGLKKGSLKFILKGKRLKGKWALIRMKDNNWLLIKEKDNYSNNKTSINNFTTSIKSDLTMDEISVGKKKIKRINTLKYSIKEVQISNPDKIIFNNPKVTKKDIILYYQKVYKKMAPFLKNRIISTIRCPNGIKGNCFFKKHLGSYNKGIGMINIIGEENPDYYYIKNESGIIAEAQMNTIEFHIWGSTIKDLDKPDIIVFDLDPDKKLNLDKIREGVKDLKSILDKLSLISFLKTSGGKGYHIVVPIKPLADYNKIEEFAKNIAKLMEAKWPERYVSNDRKINRKNKIFVDWMRNIKGATSIAPYSLRIREKATVSMPINWKDLDKIAPNDITINNAIKRLRRKDPWLNFFKTKQQIK